MRNQENMEYTFSSHKQGGVMGGYRSCNGLLTGWHAGRTKGRVSKRNEFSNDHQNPKITNTKAEYQVATVRFDGRMVADESAIYCGSIVAFEIVSTCPLEWKSGTSLDSEDTDVEPHILQWAPEESTALIGAVTSGDTLALTISSGILSVSFASRTHRDRISVEWISLGGYKFKTTEWRVNGVLEKDTVVFKVAELFGQSPRHKVKEVILDNIIIKMQESGEVDLNVSESSDDAEPSCHSYLKAETERVIRF
ncbi:uncharacterized protein BDR25DRAFT_361199 [Lindgomyces ingoldianus]|uniref:Uncharacterized protein n=1 Tax=Lindgomyces ingoldianus TaxID=673940 RepID=A0ACB6QDI7_9PLEO|nr:uncharacterized protein BDR25DRAFT_361199 [Lindgomyces ingoldianus]KAF2464979.1 hypothetical protein BDR25DRAFT_361199 [Lindgomyces ingoldianus]